MVLKPKYRWFLDGVNLVMHWCSYIPHIQRIRDCYDFMLKPPAAHHPPAITTLNILRPRQDGRHFPDDIFKCIFLNEHVLIPIKISLKFVPKGPINNILSLVQIMVWHRPGAKPLSEPMMVSLLTHICVTPPQWVNGVNAILLRPLDGLLSYLVHILLMKVSGIV